MTPLNQTKAVEAAFHEFDSMRALILIRIQMQVTLLAGTLTAVGVIAGFALQRGGNENLLLLVPALASAVTILHGEHGRRITLYGRYIDRVLWPYITQNVDPDLPSWQAYWYKHRNPLLVVWARHQTWIFLQLLGTAAIVARWGAATRGGAYAALWWLDAAATIMALSYMLLIRRSSN